MNLPVLKKEHLEMDARVSSTLVAAITEYGAFYLEEKDLFSFREEMLENLRSLFSLSESEKLKYQLDKNKSSYTGYSILKNERDNREQFHLFQGFTEPNSAAESSYSSLIRPNTVPECLPQIWSVSVDKYIQTLNDLALKILNPVFDFYKIDKDLFDLESSSCTSLLKMINYLPVKSGSSRTGTPPHCDWSFITLVNQDDNPGLSLQSKDGHWHDVLMKEGTILVFVGELLEIASGGQCRAIPHRVIVPPYLKQRLSFPFFFSPPFDFDIVPAEQSSQIQNASSSEHIHRVFEAGEVAGPFHFGNSDYNRKVLGRWCYKAACC